MESQTKVLIVDDEPRNIRIIQEILSDDFETEQAINGIEALEKAKTFRPDIVLLDIMMPDIDGLEVCKRMRADQDLAYAKILLVSGKTLQEEKQQGYEAGADDYITKPFNDDELLAKINVFSKLKYSQELSLLKTTFINVLSHETQTSLNAIIGFSSLLLKEPEMSENALISLKSINEAGNALTEKINRLLFLNSLKDKELGNCITLLTDAYINGALAILEAEINKKNINLKISLTHNEELTCNHEWMQKAFLYVIENAVKFTNDDGEIKIFDEYSNDNKRYSVNIMDNGSGLSDIVKQNLFSEFNIPELLSHQSGMGISLAISKIIIDKHNGTIVATNNDAAGSIFTISFPL